MKDILSASLMASLVMPKFWVTIVLTVLVVLLLLWAARKIIEAHRLDEITFNNPASELGKRGNFHTGGDLDEYIHQGNDQNPEALLADKNAIIIGAKSMTASVEFSNSFEEGFQVGFDKQIELETDLLKAMGFKVMAAEGDPELTKSLDQRIFNAYHDGGLPWVKIVPGVPDCLPEDGSTVEVITENGYKTPMKYWNENEGFDSYATPLNEMIIAWRSIK